MSKLKRVNIMITEKQDERLTEIGKTLGFNRSAVIRMLLEETFQTRDALKAMDGIAKVQAL